MNGVLSLPRTGIQLNHRIGLSGLLRLVDMKANRVITPKSDSPADGIAAGCQYTAWKDIGQFAGYRTRHLFRNPQILIDPSGVMRVPTEIDRGKPRPGKKLSTASIKRENKLKVMNAAKMKSLIYAAVNTFQHRFTDMRMAFFTVSFPPIVDVKNAKRFLNIWLTRLRKAQKIFMYLWVMEFQKNGTAHFHILIPGRLNVRLANRFMVETLTNAVKKKEIDWTLAAAKKYNGVDIAKDRKTRKVVDFADPQKGAALAKYLSKYITKNNAPTEYQRWHCSREWSGLCTGIALTESEKDKFWNDVDHDTTIENEFFTFYRWKPGGPPLALQKYLAGINFAFFNHYFIINGNQVHARDAVPDPQNN